jgi:hypothetical protein
LGIEKPSSNSISFFAFQISQLLNSPITQCFLNA